MDSYDIEHAFQSRQQIVEIRNLLAAQNQVDVRDVRFTLLPLPDTVGSTVVQKSCDAYKIIQFHIDDEIKLEGVMHMSGL